MSFFSSTDSDSLSRRRVQPAAVFFWLLIILAPFISAALLQLLTGTSALRLDAWNTTWNDEVGYYRVIRLLRHEFFPQGMYGFNEDAPSHLAYGPYNIFTYLPYFVLSFATGISSHNFIYYCNAALAVLAGLFYVILVRPRAREGFFTVLFLTTYLVAGRYIWSGMTESSYNFFLILFTALVLWMVKNPLASASSQKAALFVIQKVIEDAGVEAHAAGNQAVVDEYVVIGNVGVDSKADHIDTVTVIDPDEVDVMNAVLHIIHAGADKVVSGTGGNKSQDILCSDQGIEQAVDRSVPADGRDNVLRVLEAGHDCFRLFWSLIDDDFVVAVKLLRCLFQPPDHLITVFPEVKSVYHVDIMVHVLLLSL
jgi:hypothetical protein